MNHCNFVHAGYLARIKAAVLRAVVKANRRNSHYGVGQETVYNRGGKPSLEIIAHRGQGFEVRDQHDNDLTETVKAALCRWHGVERITTDGKTYLVRPQPLSALECQA